MTTPNLTLAKDVSCSRPKCRNRGYRWIAWDPDIPAFVLCRKHLVEFEMELFGVMKK